MIDLTQVKDTRPRWHRFIWWLKYTVQIWPPGLLWGNIKNTWSLARFSWGWDISSSSLSTALLGWQLARMRQCIERCSIHYHHNEVKNLKIAEVLLKRITDDDYWMTADRITSCPKYRAKLAFEILPEQDVEMLTTILRRHMRRWGC